MIDMHCHILPAVDDGSRDIGQSLEMLKEEVRQGVKDVVLTPHFRADYSTARARLEEKFAVLKDAAAKANIPVNLYLGQEIYHFSGMEKMLLNGTLLPLNGTKYVLVEFSLNRICDIAETVYTLKDKGYIPIVAHIERYFYADLSVAAEVKEIGGLIQINAESVLGGIGKTHMHKRALAIIKAGFSDFVASDFHYARKNMMAKAFIKVKKKFGEETAHKLFCENAKAFIN